MRRLIISTLIILLVSIEVHAQAAADSPEQKQAEEWIKRLNALDEWYLSADGKEEGIQPLVDSMMELYAPDVVAEVPPHDKDQIGPVMLRGKENVWSSREDRRRFTAPGAVFIQYGPDGKIRRLRLLLGEIDQVVPL